jgi:hypothetical protein
MKVLANLVTVEFDESDSRPPLRTGHLQVIEITKSCEEGGCHEAGRGGNSEQGFDW